MISRAHTQVPSGLFKQPDSYNNPWIYPPTDAWLAEPWWLVHFSEVLPGSISLFVVHVWYECTWAWMFTCVWKCVTSGILVSHLPPSLLIQGFSHDSGSLIRLVTLLQGSSAFNSRVLETQTLVLMLVEKVLRPLSRFPGPWPHLLIPLFQCEFWSNHTNHSNSQIIADPFALHFCMVWIACLYMSHHRSPANPLWQVLKTLCWMTH